MSAGGWVGHEASRPPQETVPETADHVQVDGRSTARIQWERKTAAAPVAAEAAGAAASVWGGRWAGGGAVVDGEGRETGKRRLASSVWMRRGASAGRAGSGGRRPRLLPAKVAATARAEGRGGRARMGAVIGSGRCVRRSIDAQRHGRNAARVCDDEDARVVKAGRRLLQGQ